MRQDRMLEGSITITQDMQDDCWTTPKAFAEMLTRKLGITFPVGSGEDFVVYGFQTPNADQKGKLWMKVDRADHFAGFFQFIEGRWQRFYDHSDQDVIWKVGDSREIEAGFQLIDGTVQAIPVPVQEHIMGFYRENPELSTPDAPIYNYFATVYVGV